MRIIDEQMILIICLCKKEIKSKTAGAEALAVLLLIYIL